MGPRKGGSKGKGNDSRQGRKDVLSDQQAPEQFVTIAGRQMGSWECYLESLRDNPNPRAEAWAEVSRGLAARGLDGYSKEQLLAKFPAVIPLPSQPGGDR
jgi:hypothetical protein